MGDAFGSVHDILNKVDKKHQALAEASTDKTKPSCHDPKLLQLKATSAAAVNCMEAALAILQELRGHELGPPVVIHQTIPLPTAFSQTSVSKALAIAPIINCSLPAIVLL